MDASRFVHFRSLVAALAVIVLLVCLWLLRFRPNDQEAEVVATSDRVQRLQDPEGQVADIVGSEELILKLAPKLNDLSTSVLNLQLPDHQRRSIFFRTVDLVDLDGEERTTRSEIQPGDGAFVESTKWTIRKRSKTVQVDALRIWDSLFSSIAYFDHAKFTVVRGSFPNRPSRTFRTEVAFHGLGRAVGGGWLGVEADLMLDWAPKDLAGSDGLDWQIEKWHLQNLTVARRDQRFFSEALDAALTSHTDLARARAALHEQRMIKFFADGGVKRPEKYFSPASLSQNPAVSVVDIDDDGWDDLYVCVPTGTNQLLRNEGDGTFVECAAQWGLDIKGSSTCGMFADFDNDGDPDLMLGRSVKPSVYFENEAGRFVRRGTPRLPALVTSISVADYNGDGLLDVYFSTYQPTIIAGPDSGQPDGRQATEDDVRQWPEEFLSVDEAKEFRRRAASNDNPLVLPGPPNVLMKNRGRGRFEVAAESAQIAVWNNTLQVAWSDFDGDGDPDLYVCNDWGPDYMFRNEGPRGFVDVTSETNADQPGFGMGASWGDYDNDGDQDLYVSNMYSKAGRRIAAQIDGLNPRIAALAEGNYLLQNVGSKFKQVAGNQPPALQVAKAGWSWGGQFADFDNDGFLDIYVSSGYFTVPSDYAIPVDL